MDQGTLPIYITGFFSSHHSYLNKCIHSNDDKSKNYRYNCYLKVGGVLLSHLNWKVYSHNEFTKVTKSKECNWHVITEWAEWETCSYNWMARVINTRLQTSVWPVKKTEILGRERDGFVPQVTTELEGAHWKIELQVSCRLFIAPQIGHTSSKQFCVSLYFLLVFFWQWKQAA